MRTLSTVIKRVLLIILAVLLWQTVSVSPGQAAPPADGGGRYHRVSYGETLFGIGRSYGVNPYQIARANGLKNPNHIYRGQVLYVPAGYTNRSKSYYGNRSTYGRKNYHSGYWQKNDYSDYGRKTYRSNYGQKIYRSKYQQAYNTYPRYNQKHNYRSGSNYYPKHNRCHSHRCY